MGNKERKTTHSEILVLEEISRGRRENGGERMERKAKTKIATTTM